MNKKLSTLFFVAILALTFVPNFAFAITEAECKAKGSNYFFTPELRISESEVVPANCTERTQEVRDRGNQVMSEMQSNGSNLLGVMFEPLFKGIGQLLMTLSSLVLLTVGKLFDLSITYTIIDMAKNLGPDGIGKAIEGAWATLRDLANIFFIFILIYAAFKAMFDLNPTSIGGTVKNIIIVALLINFSLFLSKVVIDASNVVAIGFYKSISVQETYNLNSGTIDDDGNILPRPTEVTGITGGYMNLLGMNGWFSSKILDTNVRASTAMALGVMSSIFMIVTAVVFGITAFMLIARYIILIFLLVLSPLAAISYMIPGQSSYFDKWWKMLLNQALFAPVFFAMTWVVFKVAGHPKFLGSLSDKISGKVFVETITNGADTGVAAIVLNFVLITGFSVAALIVSKSIASKTEGFNAITAGAAGAVFGGSALAMRNTVGRASSLVSDKYRDRLEKSAIGRSTLWLANKGKGASFDTRGIDLGKVPGVGGYIKKEADILGKAGGAGGFAKAVKTKAEAKEKYAKEVYGQSENEKDEIKKIKKDKNLTDKINLDREIAETKTATEAKEKEEKRKKYADTILGEYNTRLAELNKERVVKQREVSAEKDEDRKKVLTTELSNILASINLEKEGRKEKEKDMENNDATYKDLKEKADEAKEAAKKAKEQRNKKEYDDSEYGERLKDIKDRAKKRQGMYAERLRKMPFVGWTQGSEAAARKVEALTEEKSKSQKAADLLTEFAKDATPTPPPPTPPTTPTT